MKTIRSIIYDDINSPLRTYVVFSIFYDLYHWFVEKNNIMWYEGFIYGLGFSIALIFCEVLGNYYKGFEPPSFLSKSIKDDINKWIFDRNFNKERNSEYISQDKIIHTAEAFKQIMHLTSESDSKHIIDKLDSLISKEN
jgi:hypothetical protein